MPEDPSKNPALFCTDKLGPAKKSQTDIFASEECQWVTKPNPSLKFHGYLKYSLVPKVTGAELSFSFDARPYQ